MRRLAEWEGWVGAGLHFISVYIVTGMVPEPLLAAHPISSEWWLTHPTFPSVCPSVWLHLPQLGLRKELLFSIFLNLKQPIRPRRTDRQTDTEAEPVAWRSVSFSLSLLSFFTLSLLVALLVSLPCWRLLPGRSLSLSLTHQASHPPVIGQVGRNWGIGIKKNSPPLSSVFERQWRGWGSQGYAY